MLRKAYDAGINFFDTARSYSDSEEKLGAAFSDVRKNIYIATKTPAKNADAFWKDLQTSLDKLKTEYIDLYQFHGPPFCPKPGDGTGLYEAMLTAREKGLIRHIGISSHSLDMAEEAVRSSLYECLQFPFSYLSAPREIDLVKNCADAGMGFIAMKALSGGLITQAAAACAWMNQYENVLPIWGIQRECELDEFISFMAEPPQLDEALRLIIERDRAELSGDFCRGCGYCMPCPAGIQINMCARMAQLIRRSPSEGWLSDNGQAMMQKIENCSNCGQCQKKCPYQLDTPELLKRHLADYKNILSGKTKI